MLLKWEALKLAELNQSMDWEFVFCFSSLSLSINLSIYLSIYLSILCVSVFAQIWCSSVICTFFL